MRYLLAALLLAPITAWAQPGPVLPTVGASDLAALATTIPRASTAIPVGPSGTGAVGTAMAYVPSDGMQRQTVQRTTVLTDGTGAWTVTWSTPFVSATPTVNPIPLNAGATNPYVCNVTSRSATAAAGKCWQITSTAVALISLTISLAPSAAPASVPVMLIGAEPTQ